MSKLICKTAILLSGIISPNIFAHTGIHNEIFHPMSGVDHFLVVLAIAVISGIVVYCYKK